MRCFAKSFILASKSSRRQKLLSEAGYRFSVFPSEINESDFPAKDTKPCQYAQRLALEKAGDVAGKFPDKLVLGADTVVDCDGQIIGKPEDEKDAERIIRKLFSVPHKVITAVAFVKLDEGIELVRSDSTAVYPKKMSEEQIAEHLRRGIWKGKAGAYAIQENGDEFIEKIEGSFTNVMGLPMELVGRLLDEVL
ncbi:MAG: Maf family protein [Planctomycetota bacterium]|jgi:septum formation protein